MQEIKIIDGNIRASVFVKNNNIYVCSNSKSFDLNKYIKIFQSYSLEELYSKSENAIMFKGKGKKGKKLKVHIIGITFFVALCAFAFFHNINLADYNVVALQQSEYEISDYTTKDMYALIHSSIYLTEEEKDFLYNEELFNDLLPLINDSNYLKYMYSIYFNSLRIQNFTEQPDCLEESIEHVLGYYDTAFPSTMFVKNYDGLNDTNKDTVAHEFIHVCQDVTGYNLIIEGTCEIVKNEYYNIPISKHTRQAKLVKKLMEIIGPNPIWVYSFGGDFSLIEENVKPYLSGEDYELFLDSLIFDYANYENNIPKFNNLDMLLAKLYQAKFNSDINNNTVIRLIESGDRSLRRYYFRTNQINEENSYYLGYDEGEYQTLSLEEAVENGFVQILAIDKKEISYFEALPLIQAGESSIERVIDYESADIKITSTTQEYSKMYITGTINGIEYENYDVDTLVTDGIIKVTYYLVNTGSLSVSDYLSHNYPEGITVQVNHSDDTQINGGEVTCFVPKKIYIPPINKSVESQMKLDLEKN